ncbi:MAG TPA: hypothetical protein VJV79_09580 [Polyangiaceae bacterium]|nr:hypothetical protein [Polyangiaceae bacterium]
MTKRVAPFAPLLFMAYLACTEAHTATVNDGASAGSGASHAAGFGNGGSMVVAEGGMSGAGGPPGAGGQPVTSGGMSNAGSTASGGASPGETGGQGPASYALPPPSRCHDQDYIDFQEGCIEGDANSVCQGKCNTINACLESAAEKPHADITAICPRFMLFSDAMQQASIDDGNSAFNYAVVGHDVDRGGIDGDAQSTCCQCYQLVYAYPSPYNDRQALTNPDNPDPPVSAIQLPKPLIVQSFNTAATPHTFDVYMAAGGLGANNACAPGLQPAARSGQYLYTSYPADGQPSQGGVKPASLYQECKTPIQWATAESLASPACLDRVAAACQQITSDIPGLTEQARRSCLASTAPDSQYHLNWSVYAMKVECPRHLTEVTGCRLSPQGLPAVDRNALSATQASQNPAFWAKSTNGHLYETTTMEDCCRPSCASTDWIAKKGLQPDGDYDSFYSCNAQGVPLTE